GVHNIVSIDVGGTSADVAVAYDGHLHYAEESEIGGQVFKAPAIEIHTVGAGGGSIAWIDAGGALQVGPQSAGADPGPACYGRGGTEPTVTDANLVLGRLNPDYFLGGRIRLDTDAAVRALRFVAGQLSRVETEFAGGMLALCSATVAQSMPR